MIKIRNTVYYWVLAAIFLCCASNIWSATSKKVYNSVSATYLHVNGETPSLPEAEFTPDGQEVFMPIVSNVSMAKGKIVSVDNVFVFQAIDQNTQVLLNWDPVVRYTDLDVFDTATTANQIKYVVYFTSSRGGNYSSLYPAPFDSQTLSCTQIIETDSPAYYYIIVAVDDMDNTSGFSLETDKANNKYVYPDQTETMTYLRIPPEASSALYLGNPGNMGDNIFIDAVENTGEEGQQAFISNVKGRIVKSASFEAYRYTNRKQLSGFLFSSPVQIIMNYDIVGGKIKNTVVPADQAKARLGFYFYNGAEWIKMPAEINMTNHTVTASVGHLSKYAVIAGAQNPDKLTLSKRIPAIFTPNNDGKNDHVFFFYENPAKKPSVKLRIFDLTGSLVREINEQDQVAGQMKWNGKDSDGNLMESGIYIYQIQAGTDEFISGSLVLAK